MRKSRGGQGRRKIEIKKIENDEARHVCFSKRKNGIFNKGSELATLCAIELAIVIYSPAGNPYSFGSPAVEPVVDRFLSGGFLQPHLGPNDDGVGHRSIQQLNEQCMDLQSQLDAIKHLKVQLDERLKAAIALKQECEWLKGIDHLMLDDILKLKNVLLMLKAKADARIKCLVGTSKTLATTQNLTLGFNAGTQYNHNIPSTSNQLWAFNPLNLPSQSDQSIPFMMQQNNNNNVMNYDVGNLDGGF